MKKGCLARGLATLFFLCTLGLGYAAYYLWGQNAELTSQLDQAKAQIAADAAANHHNPLKGPESSGDELRQAQDHINKAGQDLQAHDIVGAGDETLLAMRSLEKAPKKMSSDARKQYDSINNQISGVQKQLSHMKEDASSALRKITSFGAGQ